MCRLFAEQEVGPYYVADEMVRSDISEGKAGVPLAVRVMILDSRTCRPLAKAAVDVWHCDALGLYSGFTKQSLMGPGGPGGPEGFGGPPPGGPPPGFDPQHPDRHPGGPGMGGPGMGGPENHPTDKLTFLRGIQITDADGAVNFRTVFPGYYMGRTNHIHFKVRIDGHEAGKSSAAGHTAHTGQIFFPEEFAAALMQQEPYSGHKIHRTTQAEDGVFGSQHGDLSIGKLRKLREGDPAAGVQVELVAAVDPTAAPAPAQRTGGPDGGLLGPPR